MHFNIISKKDIESLLSPRDGECKLGEKIQSIAKVSLEDLKSSSAKYVILGIPEDIGPMANCGRGGSHLAWNAFLPKFLNIQENQFIRGDHILLLGAFELPNSEHFSNKDLTVLRKLVAQIDDQVSSIIEMIVSVNKIPIVIGGGHNNSYGILKGCSLALKQGINCINLDPHADYRALEGRHSGNGFSYAKTEGFLNDYFICGLHENYNSDKMLKEMDEDQIKGNFFEEIIRGEKTFDQLIDEGIEYISKSAYGMELDCDSIKDFPSSAQTPTGVSSEQARQYIFKTAQHHPIYLHLPEAAPTSIESQQQVGKYLSYLVSDFIKFRK